MQIKFEHPVIVSGTWDNGRPRHDLVRTVSEFEIRTYSSGDVPVVFGFQGNETTRCIDGKLYTRSPNVEANPANPFAPSGIGIHTLLFAGGLDGIDPIWKMVKDEADAIKRESNYRAVENLERAPQQKELRSGHSKRSVACLKAPTLKNWKWLSPDTDAEVAAWRDRISELLSTVILIDGTPYVRTAEPRIELELTSQRDLALAFVRTKPLYTRQVHINEYELSGLVRMADNALELRRHYFGLSELDKAMAVADDLGRRFGTDLRDIEIDDHDALTVDHAEMETGRHARIALDRAFKMLMIHSGQSERAGRPPRAEYATMEASIMAQRQAIVEWQGAVGDIDAVSRAYADLKQEIRAFPIAENEDRNAPGFDLLDQFETFETRLDSEPVRFSHPSPGM